VHVSRFHRLLCIACLAQILVICSPAQIAATGFPSSKTIENWLLSGSPRLVAWGAHDALISGDQNLIPDLLSLANRWQPLSRETPYTSSSPQLSPQQTDERDAMAAVLDALIQMKVPVPSDTLRTLAPDFGNDVAILLSRMPPEEAGPLSLDFYRLQAEHTYSLQYVSAALLALHPPAGFTADLLANITVRATIFVVLPGAGPFGTGKSEGSCLTTSQPPRKDWPVSGQYALSKQKRDGAFLVVAGVLPIYATREGSTHYLGDECSMARGVYLGSSQRQQLIAEMLNTPEAIPWQTDVVTNIEFHSQPEFQNALLAFVAQQQQKFQSTAAALVANNLLTAAEAEQSLPVLELKVNDMRGQDVSPIQAPANLPPRVEWSVDPF
jgi:hypothetical protein